MYIKLREVIKAMEAQEFNMTAFILKILFFCFLGLILLQTLIFVVLAMPVIFLRNLFLKLHIEHEER